MPVLPLVGSTTRAPGASRPSRSAASIIETAMRSFTEPPGLKDSSFANTSRRAGGDDAREPDDRRPADRVEDRLERRSGARRDAGAGRGTISTAGRWVDLLAPARDAALEVPHAPEPAAWSWRTAFALRAPLLQ